jgi:hypothetical protein
LAAAGDARQNVGRSICVIDALGFPIGGCRLLLVS